ncbi:MAG: hypothetical protein K2M96_07855 [Prevotella sp.]|nr:hypothetical protein [Prevotella sp.]
MHRYASHRVPTASASCTDTLRTMRRPHPHHAPTHSAPYTSTFRTAKEREITQNNEH